MHHRIRATTPVMLLLIALALGLLAACQPRTETASTPAQANAATTPIPTLAPLPTVGLPTGGQSGSGGASTPLGGRSYVGEVRIKQQAALQPKAAGRIVELKVDVGDRVKAGDVVAVLDHTLQDAQLAQAKLQLQAAQANLAAAQAPPRDVDLAPAEAAVRAAEAGLARLRTAVRPADIAQAQSAVRAAQAGLEKVKTGATAEDREQARLRVEQSKNQLLSLQGQRDSVCGQPHADDKEPARGQCSSLQGQVQAAEAAVQIADQAYQRVQNGATDQDLALSQATLDQALAGVQRVQQGPSAAEIAQAQAAIDQARAALERQKAGATAEAIALAMIQVEVAKAAIEVAQLNVDETVLRAPFDGIVSARNGTVGAWAAGGGGASSTGVVTLVSEATEVTFDIETSLISQVEIGAPVTITVDAYPDRTFSGKVARIAPTADTSTRTFRVTADPTDPDRKLKPGMFTTVSLGGK